MNSFFENFSSYIKYPMTPKVFTEYVTKKNKFKKFIFVEGFSDKNFYSMFLYKHLNEFNGHIGYFICNGKKGVIEICNYFKEKDDLSKEDRNKFFIVDRDYDGLNNYKCLLKEKITTTKYYSLESYAFIPNNLNIIFSFLNYDNAKRELFTKIFDDFIDQIIEYEAIVSLNAKGKIAYWNVKNLRDNYELSINENEIIMDTKLKSEVENVFQNLSSDDLNLLIKEKETLHNNYLYIKGHDLEYIFDVIMDYLKSNNKLSKLLSNCNIIKNIQIPIVLK